MSLLKEIKQDIQSHNKHMTKEIMDKMTPVSLLRNTHPLYRITYAMRCKYEGMITEKEFKSIKVKNP